MNKLSIKEWAVEDRPREKMLLKGGSSLSDAELLAILIGSGNSKESAVQLSQRILHSVDNNLNSLGKLSIKELTNRFNGIGEAKAVSILAAMELGRRRNGSERAKLEKITCSMDAFRLFQPLLCDLSYEEVWVALISQSGKVIDKIKISQGGVNETAADLRLILKAAINALASGIILCHNHPSGNLLPSAADNTLTKRLQESAGLIGIRLLDHIIIADNTYYSYADEGNI
ncbi:DNA repair protein RadC [Parabacteroides sp. PF5-5]|uniref:RadC family protein n=1 Tax=unclassified Parabacteroides TaxID=2649774 RepID=UPI002472F882|nr:MULTISPECIES: DNA repair protein RadC [unclassified Parabacteroides]MDH6305044.1 DNA repair protein RadC [Parabacteroides sp. PH5-39]MDH6315871.1 DNA repair protein RadC [Parabacteroides sp. PF5-13]MDH6319528.1 DNA repair protein RadC [Parabacteroides sp. PH5-13]MDH6323259.1 DNA repair protein RadC [Parabacteroides sp. PH5-8]MDH6327233.1 DNA repair protein RadC [Parabacteroides sp. PH5-41]